ncbi:MAG: hypothetical protein HOO08_09830 [Opitutae bacterium]|jgi:hypothetical protein|nr:hypothetical protein [Opitutae bacterium]
MKLKSLLLAALVTCLISALAQAEDRSIAGGGDQDSQRKDRPNHAERGERFANTDLNGDEQLSIEEVESAGAKRLVEHFNKIDSNDDGQLTKDELKAAHKKRGKGGKGGSQCSNCDTDGA